MSDYVLIAVIAAITLTVIFGLKWVKDARNKDKKEG